MGSSGVNGLTKNIKIVIADSFAQFGILWSDLVVLSLRVDFLGKLSTLLNPFAPGNLAKKKLY